MKTETAQMVAYIARQVKEQWPHISRDKRIRTIDNSITEYEHFYTQYIDKQKICLTLFDRKESIILTIDGNLGVYYIQENDERKPIRISLLETKTIRLTKTYDYEIPVTGSESNNALHEIAKSNVYTPTVTILKTEVLSNEVK